MKVDDNSYFRGILLIVEKRYEEALKIMESVYDDIGMDVDLLPYLGCLKSLRQPQDILGELSELCSLDWLQKAAEFGYFQAQCILGVHYLLGYGVEKDRQKAFLMLEVAAKSCTNTIRRKLSVGPALEVITRSTPDYVLGCIFSSGEFVETDYLKALKHYERAAGLGDFYALQGALRILESGDGMPIDIFAAENLCTELLVDDVARSVSPSLKTNGFLVQKLNDYAKIARYKLQGEILPLARWAQKTGIPQQVLEERISRGLSDAEVLRPLDEAEKDKENEIEVKP